MGFKFSIPNWGLMIALGGQLTVLAEEFPTLCADRAAIERVYYQHRVGTKPPFEKTLPRATLENLVRLDLKKEAALEKIYGVTLTPAQLAAEVHRINTTTRAPEMLVEIKTALGHDPEKFANAFARPILVERELRRRFDNDDALHAATRRELEQVRAGLTNAALSLKSAIANRQSAMDQTSSATNDFVVKLLALLQRAHSNEVSQITWQLGARLSETSTPTADEIAIQQRFGPDAQMLSPPKAAPERKNYFEDLPAELQQVLRIQLRQPGDVSAVLETPGGFLLYLATGKTNHALSAAMLSLPKRSYEQWLNEQTEK